MFLFLQVHVVLYLYYGLTAIGIQPPWKKRLTEMQILQFLIDLVHALVGFAKHNFCTWSLLYASSMIYLFGSFYVKTYIMSGDHRARPTAAGGQPRKKSQ
jgi:hypothetical protein